MSDGRIPWSLTRRELLAGAAAAVVLPWLSPRWLASYSPDTPSARFLTPAEFALVDELSEMIIPTDDHSPGARAARVAGDIDRRLSESYVPEWQAVWRSGLRRVDDLAREVSGAGFMQSTPATRLTVLTRLAAGEVAPTTPDARFFVELKRATVTSYYTSKIGIHMDQEYKGNVYQPAEYAGFDVP